MRERLHALNSYRTGQDGRPAKTVYRDARVSRAAADGGRRVYDAQGFVRGFKHHAVRFETPCTVRNDGQQKNRPRLPHGVIIRTRGIVRAWAARIPTIKPYGFMICTHTCTHVRSLVEV